MSAIIKAVSVSEVNYDIGSIEHSVIAGEKCIEKAGVDRSEIDLLINVGIYRDENITEPAIASLIQKELKLNTHPSNLPDENTTFAFDLMNGAVGFFNAVQVVHSLFFNDMIEKALIVSSDSHPSKGRNSDYPFPHVGTAVLLEKGDKGGFEHITFRTDDEGSEGFTGYANTGDVDVRRKILLRNDDDYLPRLRDFVIKETVDFLSTTGIDLSEVLVIAAEPESGFTKKIAESIGVGSDSVVEIHESYGDVHTSAFGVGYSIAESKMMLDNKQQILFIGAGSGITACFGLYEI